MKYRIVPCVGSRIYYKTQRKCFIWWLDISTGEHFTFGSIYSADIYASVDLAILGIERKYGESAKQVNFELA